jgi:hypothetical protein
MLFHSYLRDGIVYVPTVAVREGGPVYTDIEPVAVVPATNTEALRRAFLDAIGRKNIVVPVPKGKWPAPILFSNSGPGVKLSMNILAGFRVLSAVGACPPHDGVR